MSKSIIYHQDCRHFLGHIPCKPHKEHGVHCHNCEYYEPKVNKILIIKLGALGDVIRTTPLLHKIWEEYPESEIWWLTWSPDIVPSKVDKVFKFDNDSTLVLQNTKFHKVINLDKDYEACALASSIETDELVGFKLEDGKPAPVDTRAEHKFLTGLFDDLNKKNTKSYPEEIFEICGWEFNGEDYILEHNDYNWNIGNEGKKIIGLNTGCGDRWVSRLFPDKSWIELIELLQKNRYYPLLLGGKQEHYRNEYLADRTGAEYLGHFSLNKFISLVDETDLVVSAVTMGMHIAVGLKKPLVLMNNIFNPNEFELYGRGEIVQPDKKCKCFFSPKCTNEKYNCMDYMSPENLYEAINRNVR